MPFYTSYEGIFRQKFNSLIKNEGHEAKHTFLNVLVLVDHFDEFSLLKSQQGGIPGRVVADGAHKFVLLLKTPTTQNFKLDSQKRNVCYP
jgi:hypothetical protein